MSAELCAKKHMLRSLSECVRTVEPWESMDLRSCITFHEGLLFGHGESGFKANRWWQDLPRSDRNFLKPENAPFNVRALEDGQHCQAVAGLNFRHDLCISDLASKDLSLQARTFSEKVKS